MERRGPRLDRTRLLRVSLVLAATVAGTALVGFGGVAAWQAYSDNAGDGVAAGSLGHSNVVSSQSCTSVTSISLLNQSGNTCAVIISVTGVDPASPSTLATGAVKITSTGTLQSTLSMQMPAAATGNLCPDLLLSVVDASVTDYAATALTTQMGATGLEDSAGATTWPGTAPGPAGSDTYTFTVTKGPNFNTDYADAGQSCGFSILFTQQAD
jgi:hypothetical protein